VALALRKVEYMVGDRRSDGSAPAPTVHYTTKMPSPDQAERGSEPLSVARHAKPVLPHLVMLPKWYCRSLFHRAVERLSIAIVCHSSLP
jgi:hypothetical protein